MIYNNCPFLHNEEEAFITKFQWVTPGDNSRASKFSSTKLFNSFFRKQFSKMFEHLVGIFYTILQLRTAHLIQEC